MRCKKYGICGILSFLSYTAMVVFSPLAYPGYDWLTMAVSDLTAEGAPSRVIAGQLNALFGPCAIVSIMAVCTAVRYSRSKSFRWGIYIFAAMEWLCNVGYTMFPWVKDGGNAHPQNIAHLIVTIGVVIFSLAGIGLTGIGAGREKITMLRNWAWICLAAMLIGPMGTAFMPKSVFGLFERFSTFSAVVFNLILGICLMTGKLDGICENRKEE